jgi:DNA-binding NarL/FixJ family response regulator
MIEVAPSSLASGQSRASKAPCLSPPLGHTRSATDKSASLAARPRSAQDNAAVATQASEFTTPPVVFYIDRQRLGRDCVSEQLATQLPEWSIKPIENVRELQRDGDWSRASLVILKTNATSIGASDVADEIAMIANVAPGLPLVIMSELEDATEVLRAIELGARGYLPASLALAHAVGAIRLVGEGGTYIPACVLTASPVAPQTSSSRAADGKGDPIQFSPRQLQVLELLQQGKQNKIIAYELSMCESTAKVHIRHIMRKLNARNRTQVVMMTNNLGSRSPRALVA